MSATHVLLVDEQDRPVGEMEKQAAHREGRLHRAFSIVLIDDDGRMLLQRRAACKESFPGLWSNTCCSHPAPGEPLETAAAARLGFELGMAARLRPLFGFHYRATCTASGLVEHEFDHVLLGRRKGHPSPRPDEAAECRWMAPHELTADLGRRPLAYTPWFRAMLPALIARLPG